MSVLKLFSGVLASVHVFIPMHIQGTSESNCWVLYCNFWLWPCRDCLCCPSVQIIMCHSPNHQQYLHHWLF